MYNKFLKILSNINWVVTTLIIAILALTSELLINYFPSYEVEVDNFVNDIRSAQAAAYESGLTIEFSIADDGKSYRINCHSEECTKRINRIQRLSYNTNIQGGTIYFQNNGEPLNKNGNRYADMIIYELSRGNHKTRISVSGLTGWVKILN
jgi:hypothetical protein